MKRGCRNESWWQRALRWVAWLAAVAALLACDVRSLAGGVAARGTDSQSRGGADSADAPASKATAASTDSSAPVIRVNRPATAEGPGGLPPLERDTWRTMQSVAIFGLISLAPVGLLMVTAFVRINIVLILLRQALGSPQVPGNQVLTALALLLTTLVMRPHAEEVYHRAVEPYAAGRLTAREAWEAGTRPIKAFMVEQIESTNHHEYLQALHDHSHVSSPGRVDRGQILAEDLPLRVVAPAFLLSELTTALLMGFYIYLPFLVIDLVVAAVLAATGLFMLPPALVATPVKLIVFVLADGWLLVATKLLASFATA